MVWFLYDNGLCHERVNSNCNAHIDHISKNKDNQLMKFDQLIEYNMRNILLEKSYKKCGGENNTRLVAFIL